MDPLSVIGKYYDPGSTAYYFLVHHGRLVARKALDIAERCIQMNPDREFIREAAMLHDIGIFHTDAPKIGCYGFKDYLCHGYLGREVMEREGFPDHALVCERHVGMGITAEEIRKNNLPLPDRDMMPITIEEKIICLADKFFSKSDHDLMHEKPLDEVRRTIQRYGSDKLMTFEGWIRFFHVI